MIPLIVLLLNLNAVPVLADAEGSARMPVRVGTLGEVRESTTPMESRPTAKKDSRGGVQPSWFVHSELSDFTDQSALTDPKISPAEMWVRLQEEGQPWTEPPILKGNSAIDRLRHDPE